MSRTMRAAICDGFGGPGALRIGEMPVRELSAGKVLVDIHAASVSFMDCLLVSGKYQLKPTTPFVPGTDGAGIVRAVGAGGHSQRADEPAASEELLDRWRLISSPRKPQRRTSA